MCLAANCENGTSCYELHSRVVLKGILVSIIIGMSFFVPLETSLAVKRPLYPIKTEAPGSGNWVIISTNEETR
jgi:hypothetical protein